MEKLIEAIRKSGLSINKIALETKINPSNLYPALSGKIPLYPAWRRKLEDYLEKINSDQKGEVKDSAENADR